MKSINYLMASPPKKAFKGKVKGLVVKYEKVHPRKGTLSRFRGMTVVKFTTNEALKPY